jgi:hypothetical protein
MSGAVMQNEIANYDCGERMMTIADIRKETINCSMIFDDVISDRNNLIAEPVHRQFKCTCKSLNSYQS